MKRRHIPIRTCVGCMKKQPKGELVRFVLSDDGVRSGNAEGRGFYFCPDPVCLEAALRRKGFIRTIGGRLGSKDVEHIRRVLNQKRLDSKPSNGVISQT